MPGLTAESPVQQTTLSAESNFRELDDAFLQTQARIWLGEVLQIRFDEELNISDLLADGELLFEVSEVILRMLPTFSVDETQLKVYERKSLPSNKSTRRYMPYYNVDSFLRMCKNLGMGGIDLFTPSDVVERRNTRKVCMCLRSLSKKTRLRDLNVPDFDSVTCTLAMPTDMVGGIRKSLEMSQSSSSLSVEQEGDKVFRVRFWRRMSSSASAVSNGHSDNCDEAESSFAVAESYGSSNYAHEAESSNNSGSQLIGECDSALQLNMRDFKGEVDDMCEYLSPSNTESVGSPYSQYYSDEELSVQSSNCLGSRVSGKVSELDSETHQRYQISDGSHVPIDWGNSLLDVVNYKDGNANDNEVGRGSLDKDVDTICCHDFYLNGNDKCDEHLETLNHPSKVDYDKSSEFGELPKCTVLDDFHIGEVPISSLKDATSDNDAAKHELFVREVGLNVGIHYSHAKTNDKDLSSELLIRNPCVFKPSENPDYSGNSENHGSKACTEVINVGGTIYDDRLNNGNATLEDVAGQLSFHEEHPPHIVDYLMPSCNSSSLLAAKSNGNDGHCVPARFVSQRPSLTPLLPDEDTIICADAPYSQIINGKVAFDDNMVRPDHAEHYVNGFIGGNANNSSDMTYVDLNSSLYLVVAKNDTICSKNGHDALEGSEEHPNLCEDVNGRPMNIDDAILADALATILYDPQPDVQSLEIMEETGHVNNQRAEEMKGESGIVEQEVINKDIPLHKPQRKLLKSFVKGTALLGVAFFLLHLRKNRRENLSQAKKQPTHLMKQGMPKPSQKGQNGTSVVYPAEKLHFGI